MKGGIGCHIDCTYPADDHSALCHTRRDLLLTNEIKASASPKCSVCSAPCINAMDGEHWVCTRKSCGSEWSADFGPEYAMDLGEPSGNGDVHPA